MILAGAAACLTAVSGWAEAQTRQQHLIDRIVASGTNESQEERHTVIVQGCTMTTFRWKRHEDHGLVLWTSFLFDLASVRFTEDKSNEGRFFIPIPDGSGNTDKDSALIVFTAIPPAVVRHEKSNFRPSKQEKTVSPRNDGQTHYYEFKKQVIIIQQGPEVIAKADTFTRSILEYTRDYCALTG